VVLCFIVQNQY